MLVSVVDILPHRSSRVLAAGIARANPAGRWIVIAHTDLHLRAAKVGEQWDRGYGECEVELVRKRKANTAHCPPGDRRSLSSFERGEKAPESASARTLRSCRNRPAPLPPKVPASRFDQGDASRRPADSAPNGLCRRGGWPRKLIVDVCRENPFEMKCTRSRQNSNVVRNDVACQDTIHNQTLAGVPINKGLGLCARIVVVVAATPMRSPIYRTNSTR